MKKYTEGMLRKILDEHKEWCKFPAIGRRADLSNTDLTGADLHGAFLDGANLSGANLRGVNLEGATLIAAHLDNVVLDKAELRGAHMSDANMRNATLCGANLRDANLRGASMRGVDLFGANLYNASLERADLAGARLDCACFAKAVLREANLANANIVGTDFSDATMDGAKTDDCDLSGRSVCPPVGPFTAFKKVIDGGWRTYVLELRIPGDARRVSSLVGRKCRADKAFVVAALDTDRKMFYSARDTRFTYKVGKMMSEPNLNQDRRLECAKGIHFFMELEEAQGYDI